MNNNNIVKYKDKIFLKPILNVEKDLLAPIIYNKYVLNEIEDIQYILSRFPNSNFVKLWLFNEFEQNKLIINAKIEKVAVKLNLDKFVFKFNENETGLNTEILKDNKMNKLYVGCYIINFNKQYYIGSTSNFKERFKSHTNHIEDFIKGKKNCANPNYFLYKKFRLNEIQKYYFYNEKNMNNFNMKIVYLNTNYLNKFKSIYPDYKLSKGELILLKRINDFIVKFLEQSLLHNFNPFLNMADKVIFKHFEWNEKFVSYYSRNNEIFKYSKSKKYEIFIITELNKHEYYYDLLLNKYSLKKYKNKSEVSISKESLQDICYGYNLRYYEVLANLNKYHHYESTILKNPLKIIEVDY